MTETTFCLNNYDVIGLDLDNTLARYHLRPIIELTANSVVSYMIERKSYPQSLKESLENCADFFQKGLVLDKKRGNFLKLSDEHVILQATHGTKQLTDQQIKGIYGTSRIWSRTLALPDSMCQPKFNDQVMFVFRDYFTIPVPSILARAIDLTDQNKGAPWTKSYSAIWEDVLDAIKSMYQRDAFQKNEGLYFPAIRQNPGRYLFKCEKPLLEWMKEVRRHKKLFLLTSSNIDYATVLLDYNIGPDWRDYFDLVLTFARKPGFFSSNRPFLVLQDETETNVTASLFKGGIFSQGNWQELRAFFARECTCSEPKILYVGDSLVEDVLCPSDYAGCDCVAVVEEMTAEGMVGHPPDHPASHELTSGRWGSFFCTAEGTETLLCKVIRTHAKIAVPYLSTLAEMPLDKSVPCFSKENGHAGFYPSVPLAFAK